MTQFSRLAKSLNLSPQARLILNHMETAGSLSAREAMDDHGITSAALTRRMTDLEGVGIEIKRERKVHPITGKKFTRYSLMDAQ